MSEHVPNKYVAFCDILGFSNSVLTDFEKTIDIYTEFKIELAQRNELFETKVSVYSDSIIIVDDSLLKVAHAVQLLLWTALKYKWIVRGGIGYGKHWAESDNQNLFVVSEALVNAVCIEKKIKHPVIGIDPNIDITLEYWLKGFMHSVFDLPIIHFDRMNIINPFNNYWFNSAESTLKDLGHIYYRHVDKYGYLLNLVDAIKTNQTFIPQNIIDDLLAKKLIERTKS